MLFPYRIRHNPAIYPAGIAPGFDPSHPANMNAVLCSLSAGGNFLNLPSGVAGTVGAISGSTIDGVMGRATQFGTSVSGNNDYVQFSGPATTDNIFTFSAIFRFLAFPGSGGLFAQGSLASGLWINAGNQSSFQVNVGGNNVGALNAGLPFAPNGTTLGFPFFVAVSGSYDGTKYALNCVFARLDTGQRITKATTLTTAAAVGSGTYLIGNIQKTGGNSGSVYVAAMAYNNTIALSMPQLMQWANDPWAAEFPRRQLNIVGAIAAGVVPQRNLMGVGV